MFIHLHTHSNYSFLTGAIRIEELIAQAKKFNMPAIALTDTNGMYGLIDFAKLAQEEGIKPILGVYLNDPIDPEINSVLLAKNRNGYSKICKIITERQLNEKFSLIDKLLNYFISGESDLFILTSSIKLLKNLKEKAGQIKFKDLFIELFAVSKNNPEYQLIRKKTRELYNFAIENELEFVATNPVFFLQPEDYLLHKVLIAIKFNTNLSHIDYLLKERIESLIERKKSDADSKKIGKSKFSALNDLGKQILYTIANPENYFKSPEEMKNLWRALPQAIENSYRVAEQCNVDLEFGKYKHPKFPLPEGETSFSYLWKIAFRGLEEKYKPITQQAVNRLQEELSVIEQLGFADYFLIVWDIAQQAKRMNMMMLGRGSAANSIVAYCLGLTQVDPLEHNLFFERFLNLGRASPPDIDLDFSWKERDAIVKYVFDKYGEDKVAMISTTVTFRARSAFREVAKVFGLSNSEISEYSQFIPWTSAENLPQLAEKFPEARHLKFDNQLMQTIVKIAQRLAGFPHHLSIHPGGIVISPEPITNFTALEFAENKGLGLIITQPDMYPIEDLGLVKIDLLSQRSLAVVKDTIEKIK
ncbi:MAG: DNA polymerase III subunit alpha [Ignavibacteria bacterium]|nr:DNA polymerase III subunit alpha [Ignavibacteria bacterium]